MSLINMSTIVIFIGNCATSIFFCFLWAQSHFFAWHKIQSIMMIPILMILTLMISTVMMIMILTIMMISTNVMRHPEQFSPTGGSNLRVNQHLVEGKSAKMVYFPFFSELKKINKCLWFFFRSEITLNFTFQEEVEVRWSDVHWDQKTTRCEQILRKEELAGYQERETEMIWNITKRLILPWRRNWPHCPEELLNHLCPPSSTPATIMTNMTIMTMTMTKTNWPLTIMTISRVAILKVSQYGELVLTKSLWYDKYDKVDLQNICNISAIWPV